jgi:hypothetical protein
MGLNIDTSRTLRGSHRLDELVQAIGWKPTTVMSAQGLGSLPA